MEEKREVKGEQQWKGTCSTCASDAAYAEPDSDRSRIPYASRLVPARPDRVLSWEALNDWPDEDVA
jgi:hypothetical protein